MLKISFPLGHGHGTRVAEALQQGHSASQAGTQACSLDYRPNTQRVLGSVPGTGDSTGRKTDPAPAFTDHKLAGETEGDGKEALNCHFIDSVITLSSIIASSHSYYYLF